MAAQQVWTPIAGRGAQAMVQVVRRSVHTLDQPMAGLREWTGIQEVVDPLKWAEVFGTQAKLHPPPVLSASRTAAKNQRNV